MLYYFYNSEIEKPKVSFPAHFILFLVPNSTPEYTLNTNNYTLSFDILCVLNTQVFEPSTKKWTVKAPMNDARGDFAAEALPGNRLVVAGGCLPHSSLHTLLYLQLHLILCAVC